MIRINLLEVESRPQAPPRVDRRMRAALTGAVAVAAAGLVLWPVRSVRSESGRLEQRLRAADRELAASADVPGQQEAAARRIADLSRRVALTAALQAARGAPARLLDELGRVLPDDVRLIEFRQQGDDVVIVGRAVGMPGVSDMVTGLESSGYFLPPVDIVESRREVQAEAAGVRFELRVRFRLPSS